MNTHDKYALPPPAVITSAFDPNNRTQAYYTADQVRQAIEADRRQSDTRTSRTVEQLKESLKTRNQRFVATHSEVKNLIEYYEACQAGRAALPEIKLPPLPQGYSDRPWGYEGEMFTEGQMRAHATAAIEGQMKKLH